MSLETALNEYRTAQQHADTAREALNAEIRKAHKQGTAIRQIALTTGYSRQTIYKILEP